MRRGDEPEELACVHCGSKDLWQPFVKDGLDRFLLRFGIEYFDCRKCRKRQFRRVGRKLKAPQPGMAGPAS